MNCNGHCKKCEGDCSLVWVWSRFSSEPEELLLCNSAIEAEEARGLRVTKVGVKYIFKHLSLWKNYDFTLVRRLAEKSCGISGDWINGRALLRRHGNLLTSSIFQMLSMNNIRFLILSNTHCTQINLAMCGERNTNEKIYVHHWLPVGCVWTISSIPSSCFRWTVRTWRCVQNQ